MNTRPQISLKTVSRAALLVGFTASLTSCGSLSPKNFWKTLRTEGLGSVFKNGKQGGDAKEIVASAGGKSVVGESVGKGTVSTLIASSDISTPDITSHVADTTDTISEASSEIKSVTSSGTTELLTGPGIKLVNDVSTSSDAPKETPSVTMKETNPIASSSDSSDSSSTSSAPEAIKIPGKPGYVRTPFTTPGRVIDVRDYKAGSQVRCPYTRKIFLVPGGTGAAVASVTAPEKPITPPKPKTDTKTDTKAMSAADKKAAEDKKMAAAKRKADEKAAADKKAADAKKMADAKRKADEKAAADKKAADAKKMADAKRKADQKAAADKKAADAKKMAAAEAKKKADAEKAAADKKKMAAAEAEAKPAPKPNLPPFGSRIAGQPGLVNSPFAEKHQIVNVQGLEPGVQVRCPYSGEIFRVPPPMNEKGSDEALASPKKGNKKKNN